MTKASYSPCCPYSFKFYFTRFFSKELCFSSMFMYLCVLYVQCFSSMFMYIYLCVLYVHVCADTHEGQKGAADPLELWFWESGMSDLCWELNAGIVFSLNC